MLQLFTPPLNADALFAEDRAVFAVIDPVVWPRVNECIDTAEKEGGVEWLTLSWGMLPQELYAVLPRVVLLERNASLIAEILPSFEDAAVAFTTRPDAADMPTIIARLWRVCQAELPGGGRGWFRWYDPSMLRVFAGSATPQQAALFYGEEILDFFAYSIRSDGWERYPRLMDLPRPEGGYVSLSADQLEAFGEARFELFLFELARYVAEEHFPQTTRENFPLLERTVRESAAVAERYGFETNRMIREFVDLGARHGWDFHAPDAARAILTASSDPETKIEALRRHLEQGYNECEKL